MKNQTNNFSPLASGKRVFRLWLASMVIYLAMVLVTIPAVAAHAPGLALFDLSPLGYDVDQASLLLETLGTEGRQLYLTRQLPLDFIYPGLFILAYSLMALWLANKLQFKLTMGNRLVKKLGQGLALLAVLAGLSDYAENICSMLMLNRFPELSPELVATASGFTIAKSLLCSVVFTLLLAGFAWLGLKRLKKA